MPRVRRGSNPHEGDVTAPVAPAHSGATGQRGRWKWVAAGVGGIAVGAAIAWGLITWVSADRFTLLGALTLETGGAQRSDGCAGTGGYRDLAVGASVSVFDGRGDLVAVGSLDRAAYRSDGACVFAFTVTDVPGGRDLYQVEVGNRGKVPVDETTARNAMTQLSLGG